MAWQSGAGVCEEHAAEHEVFCCWAVFGTTSCSP